MTAAMRLFLALWTLLAGHLAMVQTVPHQVVDAYGEHTVELAWVQCWPGGRPVLHYSAGMTLVQFDHELWHAADCVRTGDSAGAFGPQRPPSMPAWIIAVGASQGPFFENYCWSSQSEYVACFAQYDPLDALRWLRSH